MSTSITVLKKNRQVKLRYLPSSQ